MAETALQKRCIDFVRDARQDLLVVNIHGGGWSNKGFPDLLVFGAGKCVPVELKDGDAYGAQPDQIVWQRRFEKVGVNSYICSSFQDFRKSIEKEFPL